MIRTQSDDDFNDCVFQIESWVDPAATSASTWTSPAKADAPIGTSQVCAVNAQVTDPSSLPTETQSGARWAQSFYENNGWPYALLLPSNFRWPLEGTNIETGGNGRPAPYPSFHAWRTRYGADDATWFDNPTTPALPCVSNGYSGDLAGRAWTLND
jgi:hypothetical protein